MSEVSAPHAPIAARPRAAKSRSGWALPRVLLGNKVAFLAFCYLLLVIVVAIFAPLIAPHDPNAQDIANRLTPPAWSAHGTSAHILGTDQLGRDTFSRIIFASRLSLLVGVAVVSVTLVVGVLLGVIAGLFGGRVDHAIMAVTDVIMAFPGLLMVMTVAALMGPGLGTVIAALSVRYWTSFARITRGMVISLTKTDFMLAARMIGGSEVDSIRRHLLRNIVTPVATLIPLQIGQAMLAEATVSFLGLGVQPPSVSWGLLVTQGRTYISEAWWLITFPGLALFLTILSANILGNWLRVAFDPIHGNRPSSTTSVS